MDPRAITFDTSVLCRPFDRRFVMAAWELLGARVPILPRVVKELYGVMAHNESDYWDKVIEGQVRRTGASYTVERKLAIGAAVIEATQRWISDEIDSQETADSETNALDLIEMTRLDRLRVPKVARDIPARCFRGPSRNDHLGDRLVIAEAVITGHQILASKNRTSIKREEINHWLKKEHGVNADLVQEADDVLLRTMLYHGLDTNQFSLRSVLLSALPERETSPERIAEIMNRFFESLGKSSFPDCADAAERGWHSEHALDLIEQIRHRMGESLARATEARRVHMVREAAQRAGWRRE